MPFKLAFYLFIFSLIKLEIESNENIKSPTASDSKDLSTTNNNNAKSNTSSNNQNNNSTITPKHSSEVVYVKHVKEGTTAYLAGLREGDRPLSVDNVPINDKPYTAIVQLIENR